MSIMTNPANSDHDQSISSEQSYTGFKTTNEFSIRLEQIKRDHNFESYIDTLLWYAEHESDAEIETLVKFLNKKIVDAIKFEAQTKNLLKSSTEMVSLF